MTLPPLDAVRSKAPAVLFVLWLLPAKLASHTAFSTLVFAPPPRFAIVGVAAVAAVVIDVFMVAVKSPFVGALVRFVTVVIVPAVMFVVLATVVGNVAARKPVGGAVQTAVESAVDACAAVFAAS